MPKLIPLSEIFVPENVRRDIENESLQELKKSILAVREVSGGEKTLVQPITIERYESPRGPYKYQLRYGFRRFRAFEELFAEKPEANLWASKIPANVDQWMDDEQAHAVVVYQLVENLHRADMNPLDEAHGIERLMREAGCNQTQAAKLLGKSKGWVTQRLNLLKMDPTIQSELQDGKMGMSQARELQRLDTPEEQRDALETLKEQESTTGKKADLETTKEVVKSKKEKSTKPTAPPKDEAPADPDTHDQDVREAMLPKQIASQAKRAKIRVTAAKKKADRLEQAFFAGVEQALQFALGDLDAISYDKASFED